MKIYPVTDPAFKPYGRVAEGYPVAGILAGLAQTPLTDAVAYVPKEPLLHAAADAEAVGEALFGGMPFQLGYCNGHNTKLNCLEYHRDSEFNLGTEDFILLLAKQDELVDGELDTAKVKAFRVPAGVLVALPLHTNTDYRPAGGANKLDRQLWARNKWLIAHAESDEAKQGAVVGLRGVNIDIQSDL